MAFDLDKVIAEEEEAEPFTFNFEGEEYSLPASMDMFALAAITEGDMVDGLRRLLGDDQYDRLRGPDAAPKKFSVKALDRLLNEYAKHMGFDNMGESPASPRLSNRTARRSKPTSNASTQPSDSRVSAKD